MASLAYSTATGTTVVTIFGSDVSIPNIHTTLSPEDEGCIWQRWAYPKGAGTGDARFRIDSILTDVTSQGIGNDRQATLIFGSSPVGHSSGETDAHVFGYSYYFSALPSFPTYISSYISSVSFYGLVGLWLKNGPHDATVKTPDILMGIGTPIAAATTEAYRDPVTAFLVSGGDYGLTQIGPVGYTTLRPDAAYAHGVRAASYPAHGSDDQRAAAPLTPTTPEYGDGLVVTSGDNRIHARAHGYSYNDLGGGVASAQGWCWLPPHAEFPATFDLVGLVYSYDDEVRWYAAVTVTYEGGETEVYSLLLLTEVNPSPGNPFASMILSQSALSLVDKPGAVQYRIDLLAYGYITEETLLYPDVNFCWATKGCLPMACPNAVLPAGTACVEVGLEPGQVTA